MKKQLTDEMFQKALFDEDDLGSVIRVHLHVEYHVNEIISKLVSYEKDLKPLGLDFNGKVNLICALGVKPEYKPVLSTLGSMRNKFAHDPFYKITKTEINNLYKALPSNEKDILQKAHEKTRKANNVKAYAKLAPRDKFILIAVVIRNIVIAINNELSAKNV